MLGNFFVKVAAEFVTMFMEWMLFAGCHSAELHSQKHADFP
jgi:hypothetical protein